MFVSFVHDRRHYFKGLLDTTRKSAMPTSMPRILKELF